MSYKRLFEVTCSLGCFLEMFTRKVEQRRNLYNSRRICIENMLDILETALQNVFRKSFSENMLQIYQRTTMLKYDFNKVATANLQENTHSKV